MTTKRPKQTCTAPGCCTVAVARGMCATHYYVSQQRIKRLEEVKLTLEQLKVDHSKRSSILIRDRDMQPLFVLDFYGLTDELTTVGPGLGGNIIAAALQRRGIDPEAVSFNVFDVASDGASRSPMWEM